MRHDVGRVDDYADGSRRILQLGKRSVGVFRIGQDFHAVLNHCPHNGAAVCLGRVSGTMLPSKPFEYEYAEEQVVLRCPWHGWEFDLASGKCLFGVDGSKVKTYPVTIENDTVFVDVP